jgi:N-acetylglucosamine-6-sulfatase
MLSPLLAATLLATTLPAATLPTTAIPPARPNILFIMSDDHGKQAISCYGSTLAPSLTPSLIMTPGIDRIAREGMRFDRSSVTNAICGPSRAVMLTGKHSHINGFVTNENKFDGAQQTFPKLLQAAGYRTEIIGKWHLESDPTGFDHWDVLVGQGDYWNPTFIVDGVKTKREGHVTDIIHHEAIERLDALAAGAKERGQPFALLVHHKAPHRNWMPQPRYYQLFNGIKIPEPATLFDDYAGRSVASSMQKMQVSRDLSWDYDLKVSTRQLHPVDPAAPAVPGVKPDPLDQWMATELSRLPLAAREAMHASYAPENDALAAAIGSMDARALTSWKFQRYAKDYLRTAQGVDDSVGALLAELDRLAIADNTLVVYTSDQGWFLGEHGWFDKRWMYEESFRMPLVLRWPRVAAAGGVSAELVQNLDFAPTFLEAAGAAIPADLQGKSMLPLLRAGGATDKPFREAAYYRFEESNGPHTVPRHEGVATARYKLIRFLDLKSADGSPVLELYDLEADPDERTSLADRADHAALQAELLSKLEALRAQYQAPR